MKLTKQQLINRYNRYEGIILYLVDNEHIFRHYLKKLKEDESEITIYIPEIDHTFNKEDIIDALNWAISTAQREQYHKKFMMNHPLI